MARKPTYPEKINTLGLLVGDLWTIVPNVNVEDPNNLGIPIWVGVFKVPPDVVVLDLTVWKVPEDPLMLDTESTTSK